MASEIIQKVQAVTVGLVQVTVGSKLATGVKLKEHSPLEATVSLDDLAGKNLIVGVPGAFTSTCTTQVPGYIKNIESFTAKGVKSIYVVSVNDQFVMEAWKEKLGAADISNIHFLADDQAKFSAAIGLTLNATPVLGNTRSKRYVLLLEDGIVRELEVEDGPGNVTVTKADNVLAKL